MLGDAQTALARMLGDLCGETMTTAVIGATGRFGGEIVRGLLARGDAVERPHDRRLPEDHRPPAALGGRVP
jgi:hypothetical protein